MNFDTETKDGMENAVRWTEAMISQIRDGGVWMIPRSGTLVQVSHKDKTVKIIAGIFPEKTLRRVFAAMNWTVK